MTDTLQSLLARIAADQTAAGETVDGPAPWPAIARAELWVRDRFAIPLPQVLSDLWAIRDGVAFNGMKIYRPTEDEEPRYLYRLRSTNETFAEVTGNRYLHIGEADMDAYVLDTLEGGWHMADKVSLESFERFETCEELVLAVLRKYLDMWQP
ncbi:MAG: YrhA family protein [Sphingomonas sp.]